MIGRDREALIAMLMFPIIFVVVFSLFDMQLLGTAFDASGSGDGTAYLDFVLPGLIAMNVTQFSVLWTAAGVTRFRELSILKRLSATPLRPISFISGQVAARSVMAVILGLVILVGGMLLGANVAGSIPLIVGLVILGNLVFVSLGFAAGGRASSVDAATTMGSLLTMPMSFLSGVFFPIEALPAWMQSVVAWLPLTPLLEAMRAVALDGAGVSDVSGDLVKLLAWLPVMLVIAAATFRFSER
jgi:ABC-2 type transport system permease protein